MIFIFEFCGQVSHNFKNQEQKNRFVIATLISMLVIFQNGKTEYKYVDVLPDIFMPLLLIAQSNLTHFSLLNIDKSLEKRTGFSTFIFAICARIKQPVYVLISKWFGWEIYFPLLS